MTSLPTSFLSPPKHTDELSIPIRLYQNQNETREKHIGLLLHATQVLPTKGDDSWNGIITLSSQIAPAIALQIVQTAGSIVAARQCTDYDCCCKLLREITPKWWIFRCVTGTLLIRFITCQFRYDLATAIHHPFDDITVNLSV